MSSICQFCWQCVFLATCWGTKRSLLRSLSPNSLFAGLVCCTVDLMHISKWLLWYQVFSQMFHWMRHKSGCFLWSGFVTQWAQQTLGCVNKEVEAFHLRSQFYPFVKYKHGWSLSLFQVYWLRHSDSSYLGFPSKHAGASCIMGQKMETRHKN